MISQFGRAVFSDARPSRLTAVKARHSNLRFSDLGFPLPGRFTGWETFPWKCVPGYRPLPLNRTEHHLARFPAFRKPKRGG